MFRYYMLLVAFLGTSVAAVANNNFDATSYEILQNCMAEAEATSDSADYANYCIDSYLSTQQISSN